MCGPSYVKRLWCIWELYTVFAFCREDISVDRIEVLPVGNYGFKETIQMLKNFDLDEAHCFDPNEEMKLRKIIYEVGEDRFCRCIKNLALKLELNSSSSSSKSPIMPMFSISSGGTGY